MDEFEQRWLAFVARYADTASEQQPALVAAVLESGLPEHDAAQPLLSADLPAQDRLAAEFAVISASGEFDAFGYWWHNQDPGWNLCGSQEELRHFLKGGWTELRHPSAHFDLWFYWNEYLDPRREDINPLVHYVCEGKRRGLLTLPEVQSLPPAEPTAGAVRRVCLFAAFDLDGVVDPTVVAYLADLSQHADIYYLADCEMAPGELEKIAPYTAGRWAIRHGRYDFGSYSMLAQELVGWDVIEGYDELILANDSCYLVQPFETVFAKMDQQAADWWGLQGTYEHFTTEDHARLGRPLRVEEVQDKMRHLELWRYSDFIHVGSYFLVYRRRVIDDLSFRTRLNDVVAQTEKTTIILKYEIGFSRYLILKGYELATFVDGILPYHPVYRESAFDLMAEGFPLLKRQFLYENPFSTPDLAQWKSRVRALVPDADVDAMERNLHRVAPAWSLHRSFGIHTRADGSINDPNNIGPDTFDAEDKWAPKHPHWWLFPVDSRTGVMSGEARGVFEAVREDPSIHKIVLTAGRPVKLSGARVTVAPVENAAGQMYALRSRQIFVTSGPRSDVNHPLSARYHRFVALGAPTGHETPGVPLHGLWEPREAPPRDYERSLVSTVVVASEEVAEQASAIYPRLESTDIWASGSPRIDLLVGDEADLSPALRDDLSVLRSATRGRRVVVISPLSATDAEIDDLGLWAQEHPDVAVLWAAPPTWDTAVPAPLVDLYDATQLRPHSLAPHPVQVEMAWRIADVVVTGWIGDLADAARIDLPVVALPGAAGSPLVVQASLRDGLDRVSALLSGAPLDESWLAWGKALHAASDGHSGARVARRLRGTYLPLDEWEQDPVKSGLSAG